MIPALPEPSVLLPFLVASLVVVLTPGPDMTYFVGRSLAAGRAFGLAAFFGTSTGVLIHTLAVALGLSGLIVAAPALFFALKIAGAGYLVWLAIQALRHGSALSLPKTGGVRTGLLRTWASGLAINLLNPKIVLFFMTFLPQFVSAGDPAAPNKLIGLGLIFVCIAVALCVPMVLAADRFAALMRRSPRITRIIDWLFASVFFAFAAQILFSRAR